MAPRSDIKAGSAYVELYSDDRLMLRGLAKAQRRLRAFGVAVSGYGSALAKASAVILAPAAMGLRTYAKFDDQMRELKSVSQMTEAQFLKLNDIIRQLGRSTSYTAQEVAAGATELGRAGLSAQEIGNTLESVLALGRAGKMDLASTAQVLTNTIRAFGIGTEKAADVADVLFATTTNSTQGMGDLSEAMKYVAPEAKEAGATLRDTAAAIGVLADVGIRGSMAGTSLRAAYSRIVKEPVQKRLEKLGVTIADQQGNLRGMAQIIGDIGRATEGLGSARRLQIFTDLFGARAKGTALKLANVRNFDVFLQKLSDIEGAVARASAEMDAGPGGSWRKMMSAVESVMISIGESIEKSFQAAADCITKAAMSVDMWVQKNRGLILSAVKVAATVAGIGVALITLGAGARVAAFAIGSILTAAKVALLPLLLIWNAANAVASAFAFLLSPIGLVSMILVSFGAILMNVTQVGQEFTDSLIIAFGRMGEAFGTTWKGIVNALKSGDLRLAAKVAMAGLKVAWLAGTLPLRELWDTLIAGMKDGWNHVVFSLARGWERMKWFGSSATTAIARDFHSLALIVTDMFWGMAESVVKALETVAEKVGGMLDHKAIAVMNPAAYLAGAALRKLAGAGGADSISAMHDASNLKWSGRLADAEQQLAEKRAARDRALAALNDMERQESMELWRQNTETLRALRKGLRKAEEELAKATAEARWAAFTGRHANPGGEVSGFAFYGGEDAENAAGEIPSAESTAETIRNVTSKGLFDIRGGLLSMQGATPTDHAARTAENTAKTADNTQEIKDKLDENLSFA